MTTQEWKQAATAWVATKLSIKTTHIPVFDTTDLVVKVRPLAKAGVLCRSAQFDFELAGLTDAVRGGHTTGMEGMLYCLYVLDQGCSVPVYIGIAGATGHTGKLSSLFENSRKKPRFDDYDGYHIGDLSTQVVPGYAKRKAYKSVWANRLFTNAPSNLPQLRTLVYFWGKAWCADDVSVVACLGHTPLFLEECLLVHACRTAFPGRLLNA